MPPQDRSLVGLARAINQRLGRPASGFGETVNVTAKMPPASAPMPPGSEELILGSATEPPKGAYTPPAPIQPTRVDIGKQYPNISRAWQQIAKERPFVARNISRVATGVVPRGGEASYGAGGGARDIMVSPSMETADPGVLRGILEHELTHSTQDVSFPDYLRWLTQWRQPLRSYHDQAGEAQAYGLMDQAINEYYKVPPSVAGLQSAAPKTTRR